MKLISSVKTLLFISSVVTSGSILASNSSGLSIDVTGYYLKPSTTNDNLLLNPTPPANISLSPKYDLAGAIKLDYLFPNTTNDIGLQYLYIYNNRMNKNFVVAENIEDSDVPITSNIDMHGKFNVNQVDLTAGHTLNLSQNLFLHPYVGIRGADIKERLIGNESFTGSGSADFPIQISGNGYRLQNSEYNGIGPLFGMDAHYFLTHEFSVEAGADTALLIGNIRSQETNYLAETIQFFDFTDSGSAFEKLNYNARRQVPVVDLSASLDYNHRLGLENGDNITLKTGWKFSEYFNSLDKVSADLPDVKTSNLTFNGPFVELGYSF